MKKKDFDAVEMMRRIRDKHYEIYKKNPELKQKRLSEIRKKYKIKQRIETNTSN
jgi:hypothetical protein